MGGKAKAIVLLCFLPGTAGTRITNRRGKNCLSGPMRGGGDGGSHVFNVYETHKHGNSSDRFREPFPARRMNEEVCAR